MVRYQDWTGERKQKCKRGFATKREAQEWERSFQMQTSGDLDMTFEAFTELYTKDVKPRLKENTWLTKENIIQKKILPYFGKRKISEITTKDVIAWQNELLAYRDEKRKPYSATYLKTLHNQLSAIFNHAVRFYELRSNPAAKAGNMGSEERKEMLFWTKAEYQKFADAMMDKPVSYYAFEMLYHVSMGLPLWGYPVHKGTVGWNVTDCKICFEYGLYYSPVSTPADFRSLAPIVLEQALKESGTQLLEPYLSFTLYAPQEYLSRAYHDAPKYCATIETAQVKKDEVVFTGEIPARCIQAYRTDLAFYTNGRSVCLTELKGYQAAVGEPVIQPRRPNSRLDKVRHMFSKIP